MWSREQLKQKAKYALKQNYWKIVLVSLIAVLVGGASGSSSPSSGESDNYSDYYEENYYYDEEYYYDESNDLAELFDNGFSSAMGIFAGTVMSGIVLIVVAVAAVVSIFVCAPLEVGTKRFFYKSLNEKAEIKEILHAFDHSYMNVVKVMFHRNLKIFLWSLLFVIPGIVKSYEYRMVPYLLAENPDLTHEDALKISRRMMDGNKWDTFILEWSFFGWNLLAGFTLGILSILYVNPYENLTYAALYEELSIINGRPAFINKPNMENPYSWTDNYEQTNWYEQTMEPTYTSYEDSEE